MKKKTKTFICILIALLTIVSFPSNYLMAMETSESISAKTDDSTGFEYNYLENETIDFLREDDLLKVVRRLDTPKDDLRTVRFLMSDGTEEMMVFNEAIKYIDSDGHVHTKSMELFENSKTEKYKYSNKHNDISMNLGRDFTDGVSIKYKENEIIITPENASKTEVQISKDNRTAYYKNGFSERSRVEYVAEYSGLKEKIILEKYEGIDTFSYIISTKLSLELDDGVVKAYDGNTLVGSFGSAFITDMENNSIIGEVRLEQKSGTEYRYELSVPTEYLLNEETAYPVVVDPTFYFNQYANNFAGYKQIYDVTLYESGIGYNPDDEFLSVSGRSINGIPISGKSKILIKLPNILSILKKIGESNLLAVYISYTGLTNSTNHVVIKPMDINWNTRASSLTPSEYGALYNGTLSSQSVFATIYQGPGLLAITDIAKDWINSLYPNRGIMIENPNYGGSNLISSTEYTDNSYYRPFIKVKYKHINDEMVLVDPLEGFFKLKPVDESGLITFFAMKNTNNIVTTTITSDIYNNDQLMYINATPLGYTIQNPYNDYYLTSVVSDANPSNCALFFSQTATSGSYWSFVNSTAGYYIVGTSQEQVYCPAPYTLSSDIIIQNLPSGISGNQSNTWSFERQIDKIPHKLKNVSSEKFLTTNGFDYDICKDNNNQEVVVNVFQHSLYEETNNTSENPVFGCQSIRPVKNDGSGGYTIYLMSSKNGRFRSLAWDSTGNAFQYNPSSSNNRFTITIDNSTGYAKIKQKTGSHLVLSVTDDNEGDQFGVNSYSPGNIIFASPNNQDLKQKWILIPDLVQFKKEAYYSRFDVCLPLPNSNNKQVNSDYGPRTLSQGTVFNIHDGIDLYAELNTPVYATITGEVAAVVSNLNSPGVNPSSRGLYVLIKSESNNIIYKYGTNSPLCMVAQHLNSVNVTVGQSVTAGQIIGYTGKSGLTMTSYGAHFHYAYCTESDFYRNDSACDFVDPLFFHVDASLYETTKFDGAFNLKGLE